MTSGYQLSLDGLFTDEQPVDTIEDACCSGDTHHVPHCPTYLAEVRDLDQARERASLKTRPIGPTCRTINRITITAYGKPAPQGSKDAFPIYEGTGAARRFTGRVALVEASNKDLKAWRRAIAKAAKPHVGAFAKHVPLLVEGLFSVARPTSAPAHTHLAPVVAPDVDKYLRGLLDALVIAGVMPDDGQVVDARGVKDYAGFGRGPTRPGVIVTIARVLR